MNFKRWLFLACATSLLSGCATRNHWQAPLETASAQPAKEITFQSRNQIAAFLSLPGDILLLHLGDSAMDSTIKQIGMYPAGAMDLLALQEPFVSFLHTEVIEDISPRGKLQTSGFYPIVRQYHGNQFGRSFAVFGMREGPTANAAALTRLGSKNRYHGFGYCGDYAAWLYNHEIYSWWNRAPGLQRVFIHLYPPEAIHTADHIANSPDTERLIEIRDGELIYPTAIPTAQLLERAQAALKADQVKLVRHGQRVTQQLADLGFIGADNRILIPEIRLKLVAR